MKAASGLFAFTLAVCGTGNILIAQVPKPVGSPPASESPKQPNRTPRQQAAGRLAIVNQYGGGIYFLTIEPGAAGGPFKVAPNSLAEQANRVTEGTMYGTTLVIADGRTKEYSLEAGSYFVTLNFYKPGKGVYTMTDPPIVVDAGQTSTLTITSDGKLHYREHSVVGVQ